MREKEGDIEAKAIAMMPVLELGCMIEIKENVLAVKGEITNPVNYFLEV